jgi:hypothetical protein
LQVANVDVHLLPIRADALEDAGGTNQDMLLHCRGGATHVRDCWVVELMLANKNKSRK